MIIGLNLCKEKLTNKAVADATYLPFSEYS